MLIKGLVSTIIPVFNRPARLREAVASVLDQDYRPIEIIIVDDGSTDTATSAAAAELAAQAPDIIRVLTVANGGPGLAREAGRQVARGEFIQYLDSDDVLLPEKFSRQVRALEDAPTAGVAYGITLFRDASGCVNPTPHKGTGTCRAAMFPHMLNDRWWDTSTPLYRRRAVDAVGPWTALRLEEDWEYDCRVAAHDGLLAYVQLPVSETRDHADMRLSVGGALDPIRAAIRARSHALVWEHSVRANLHASSPEAVALFARSLFLLARQCGAAGLANESRKTFEMARAADESIRAASCGSIRRQLGLYRFAAATLGWRAMGKLSVFIDLIRNFLKR